MTEINTYTEQKHWKELGFGEKLKYGLATFYALCSVLIGVISFIILYEIPGSVLAISGIWMSGCLAILGITQYFKTQLVEFQTKVDERLNKIDQRIKDDISHT